MIRVEWLEDAMWRCRRRRRAMQHIIVLLELCVGEKGMAWIWARHRDRSFVPVPDHESSTTAAPIPK